MVGWFGVCIVAIACLLLRVCCFLVNCVGLDFVRCGCLSVAADFDFGLASVLQRVAPSVLSGLLRVLFGRGVLFCDWFLDLSLI